MVLTVALFLSSACNLNDRVLIVQTDLALRRDASSRTLVNRPVSRAPLLVCYRWVDSEYRFGFIVEVKVGRLWPGQF